MFMKDSELVMGLIQGVCYRLFWFPERTCAADAVLHKIFPEYPSNNGRWADEKDVDKRQEYRGIHDGEDMSERHPPLERYVSDSAKKVHKDL
jgi:hypothetical protein